MSNKTKIIATIGPASDTKTVLRKMISAGMNLARLNFSHGTYQQHIKVIKIIRSLAEEMGKPIGILLDLPGPKIRTGNLAGGNPVVLKDNAKLSITSKNVPGTAEIISTTYLNLSKDVKKGDSILIDDGLIELQVISKTKDTVNTEVIAGGILKEHKGINLPGVNISAASLTEKDKEYLKFGIEQQVDYFAMSFVRTAKDLKDIKASIKKYNASIPVIAKIEKPEAVENLDEIVEVADAIMVARGDLGVEMEPELIPPIQKLIINKTISANKPVITATQMLETMTNNAVPTRAEASDVANAIFDGTDAVMLSAETATGKYPVKTIEMMSKIAFQAESSPFMKYNIQYEKDEKNLVVHAIAQSAVNIHHEVNAKAIVAFSVSGKTSKLISKQRPSIPVYAFSPSKTIFRRLSLVWGVTPLLIDAIRSETSLIEEGEEIIVRRKFVKKDDLIIMVTGLALTKGSTNLIKLHCIGHKD